MRKATGYVGTIVLVIYFLISLDTWHQARETNRFIGQIWTAVEKAQSNDL